MKKIFAIVILAALPLCLSAKNRLSGTVSDEKGQPLVGAVVQMAGAWAITDAKGAYSLEFDGAPSQMQFSMMGFKSLTRQPGSEAVINVVLKEDSEQLEETVVIGYGSMRKSDLTGAVTSIRISDSEAAHNSSFDKLLQGKAAGVQVVSNSSAPDAGVSVTIRGMSTFEGNSQPLYVVDGVIINTSGESTLLTHGDDSGGSDEATNGLMGINAQDIASVEILKDASATAIYGSQGANGVVLITTKTAKENRPTVSFSAQAYVQTPYKKMDMLPFDGYVSWLRSRKAIGGEAGVAADGVLKKIYDSNNNLLVQPTDWQDYLMQTSLSQKYYLSVSGKTESTSYRFSFGYTGNNGIIKTTGYDNLTSRINLEHNIGKRFTIGTKTGLSWLKSNLAQGASTKRSGPASSMMRSMLFYTPYKALDSEEEEIDPDDDTYRSSPAKWITEYESKRNEFRVTPSIYAQVKILPWLSFKTSLGGDYRSGEASKWKTSKINTSAEGTIAAVSRIDRLSYNFDNVFQMYKKAGSHKINGMLGFSMSSAQTRSRTEQGWEIKQYKAGLDAVNSAPYGSYSDTFSEYSLMSAFGRAVYNYDERYVLTATLRYDGSSKFQGSNKWSLFPSFAFAWRANQEKWFNVPAISSLKLRAGWGNVGNQAIIPYQTRYNFSRGNYADHNPENEAGKVVAIYPANIANPELKWETTSQANVGLDLGMWKGRLNVSAELYYKLTKDLLQKKKMAGSSGFDSMYLNIGSICNKGAELTLEAYPVRIYDFEWSLGGNISFNSNRILSIGDGSESGDLWIDRSTKINANYFYGDQLSSSYCAYPLNIFIEGHPMDLFYGMPTDGILQKGEKGVPMTDGTVYTEGMIKYVDTNGDGVISELDRIVVGNPTPAFTYGFNTGFTYKGISLNLSFVGSYGNSIYNVDRMLNTNTSSVTHNIMTEAYLDAWSEKNPGGAYPSLDGLKAGDTKWIIDRYVEDGSYLRLSDVSLSYAIPLRNKKVVKGIDLGLSASNLVIWTSYKGWDPDINSFGTTRLLGADMGSYPSARTFRIDFKIKF